MLDSILARFFALSAYAFSMLATAWVLSALMPPDAAGVGKLDTPDPGQPPRRTKPTKKLDIRSGQYH